MFACLADQSRNSSKSLKVTISSTIKIKRFRNKKKAFSIRLYSPPLHAAASRPSSSSVHLSTLDNSAPLMWCWEMLKKPLELTAVAPASLKAVQKCIRALHKCQRLFLQTRRPQSSTCSTGFKRNPQQANTDLFHETQRHFFFQLRPYSDAVCSSWSEKPPWFTAASSEVYKADEITLPHKKWLNLNLHNSRRFTSTNIPENILMASYRHGHERAKGHVFVSFLY